jgi:biotin carboxylase
VRCADDLPAAAAAVGFPAVLKPTSGFGSFATFRVHGADELAGLYATARLLLDHDAPRRGTATFLLEELLIGRAPAGRDRWGDFVSIESVVVGGEVEHLTVTDKFPLAEPFRETGHIMPSTLDQGTQGQLAEVARVAIGALGLTDGACHTEIKLTADGPRVIEVNARLGGGLAEVWRLATGGDSFCDLARIALELPRARRRSFQRHACMFSPLTPARDVVVERIGDLRSVAAVPGVELASGILRRGAAPEWRKGEGILVCVYATAGSADGLFSMRDGVLAALDVGYAEAA